MAEHVAADEEEDGNHASRSPEVAALNNWKNIWQSSDQNGDGTGQESDGRSPLQVIDRTLELGVRAAGKVTNKPGMDGLGRTRPRIEFDC